MSEVSTGSTTTNSTHADAPGPVRVRFCPSPTGTPARRPDPHRPVQLGVRPPPRRHVRLPDRGHRRRARQPRSPTTRCSTRCAGSASTGTRASRSAARTAPYRQSERGDIYADVAAPRLLEAGHRTSATPPPRRSRRARKAPAGTPSSGYDNFDRDLTDEQIAAFRPRAASRWLRLRMPDGDDHLRRPGPRRDHLPDRHVPDFVVVRANGEPLYTLVNPVDDALMGITHVLRGEDLLRRRRARSRSTTRCIEIGIAKGDARVRPPAAT